MNLGAASVVFDVQGAQDPLGAERGIGRYIRELGLALAALPSRHLSCLAVNADEPMPGSLEPLLSAQRFVTQEMLDQERWNAYHVGSLFDVEKRLDRVVPPRARRPDKQLLITLYDLIPLLFPKDYLADPVSQARYTARLQLLRRADLILAISEATAADAVEHVGVDPSRICVVGAGVSSHFRPPADRRAKLAQMRLVFPQIHEGFMLVTGAGDPRKNHRGLFKAYSRLPNKLREDHQLVVVGRLDRPELHALQLLAARLRVRDRVVFTGFVEDDTLLLLYQTCDLFVFPSYYEGFGLPVVEALASGAPVIAADSSSLREIIRDPDDRFEPDSAASMSERIHQALSDGRKQDQLRRPDAATQWSWPAVAQRVEAAYEAVLDRPRTASRRRHKVAWISPLPPQRSRAATLSAQVLELCPTHVSVDPYHSGSYQRPLTSEPIELRPTRSLDHVERLLGAYDAVIYCLDGRPYSADPLWLLRQRPGIVIGLDLRLATVYQWRIRNRPEPELPSLADLCESQYGATAAAQLERVADPTIEDLDRLGILMSREMLELSVATLVQSACARDLARLEAPSAANRIEVLPWAVPAPPAARAGATSRPGVITAFGWIDSSRQAEKLVATLPMILRHDPSARLAFVGPIDATFRRDLQARAQELRVDHALTITGAVDDRTYRAWLEQTTIAVQLRGVSNGESPSTVAECLSRGVPTLVTEIGAIRELPAGCTHPVSRDVTADELATEICALLSDHNRRASLAEAGRAFASGNTVEMFAELLWERALA